VADVEVNDNPSGPDAPGRPVAETEPGGAASDAGFAAEASKDKPGDVGDDDDEKSTGSINELRHSKKIGDRAIGQARRSAIGQGNGPATYIERQSITYSGRRVFIHAQIFENQNDIEREFATWIEVAGFAEMCEKARSKGLLVLRGQPGSGRAATARMLLHKIESHRLGMLSVNTDDDLFYILHENLNNQAPGTKPLMSLGDGFIIELAGDLPSRNGLTGFAEAVKAVGAYVVVIVDSVTEAEPPASEFEVIHSWPEPRAEILAKHLDARLGEREHPAPGLVDEYRKRIVEHQAVRSQLNLAPSVHRIVEMARFLAGHINEVPVKGVGSLVSEWDDSARHLAREILRGDAPQEKPYLIPQQQAFRIAYAVFHEQPLAYVFEAGELLLEKLISVEVRKRPLKSRVFDRSVEALIHPKMAITAPTGEDDGPRRARLTDESLILSILEVAWHEYAQLRAPLMSWLDDLAGSSEFAVRVRAAQMVGLLATFDYLSVTQLIRPWARRKAVYRDAAALAMDQIARHPPSASAVTRQIEEWSSSKLITEQDAAARWHGLRTDEKAVAKAIEELRKLGGRPELRRGTSIAMAMSLLFLNGNVDAVLDELARWIVSENPYQPHHAVKTLLSLTDPRGGAQLGRARLSELAAANADREQAVVQMWRRALASRTVGGTAWNALREWLIEADQDEERIPLMESLAVQIFTGVLRQRALFNLTLWQKRRPGLRLVGGIRTRLTESRGN
jgi:hypothetical protein